MKPRSRYALMTTCSIALGGCGLATPSMQEIGQSPERVPLDKNALVGEIKCEITRGVYAALHDPRFGGDAKNPGNSVNWFRQWVVKADLAMTVDDKGTFGPGVTFTSPFGTAAQSVSVGIGVQVSSEAQRKEEVGFIYALNDLVTVLERQVAAPETDPNAPNRSLGLVRGEWTIHPQ